MNIKIKEVDKMKIKFEENRRSLRLNGTKISSISRESYDLIKKNNTKVYGVDIDALEIEED